jgi:hypothetical protein
MECSKQFNLYKQYFDCGKHLKKQTFYSFVIDLCIDSVVVFVSHNRIQDNGDIHLGH